MAVIGKTHTSVSAMRDSSDTRCLSAPTALSLVTMKRLFMDSGGAFGGPPAQSGLAVKCLVAAPHSAAGHVRSTTCCRPDRRNVVSGRKLVSTNTDVPSRIALAQAGAAMGSWHHREPMVFFGKGDLMIHKALRFCQVGVCSRRARTAQTRTPSSGASRRTHGFVAPTTNPLGSSVEAAQ